MPEHTHPPTAKKLREARRQGVVPRSALAAAALSLITAVVVLLIQAQELVARCFDLARSMLESAGQAHSTQDALDALEQGVGLGAWSLGGLLAVVWTVVGVGVFLQVGPGWSWGLLRPRLDRLAPSNSRRKPLDRSVQDALLRLGLGGALAGIVAVAIYAALSHAARGRWTTLHTELSGWAGILVEAGWQMAAVWVIVAVGDVALQRWRWRQDTMMSTRELERERRESGRGPVQKYRRRQWWSLKG